MASGPEPVRDGARRARIAALGVALLALLPSLGTLRAPWIAEDASILAQVRADGPWADWTRSQYGLLVLPQFWRPLVSTSWALQAATTGIEPLPLRLFNVGLHALVAVLAFACARRAGTGLCGAFVAGAWIALFPEQGGTSTWLAGRTDLLAAAGLLASVFLALGRAPVLAALPTFLACASKEFGFLAPLWIGLLARGRGEGWRAVARRMVPAFLAAVLAFAWRTAALGTFRGGYEGALPGLAAGVPAACAAVLRAAWPSLLAFAALAGAGACARCTERRGLASGLAAAGLALLLLYPLLAHGWLEPENRRLLYVPECALGLALGFAWSRPAERRPWRGVLPALALAVLGARGVRAWNDTHAWARSARAGEELVARARAALAGAETSSGPVLFADFPVSRDGAYCLGFGLAARFRAPFPATPRPVWPWRLVFAGAIERERSPLVAARADGSLWPLDDPARVPALEVLADGAAPAGALALDERAFLAPEDRSPRLEVRGGPAGAALELLLVTEEGYEPYPCGSLDASGAGELSLMRLLTLTNGITAADALKHAADLGATRAYLEFRARDAGGGVLAASRWIEVAWRRELLALALSAR